MKQFIQRFLAYGFKGALAPAWEHPGIPRQEISLDSAQHDLADSGKRMVALTFGQSNGANYGESRHCSGSGVLNWYRGRLYHAEDPLLGANGNGGSVWTRLGDRLIASGQWQQVIFAPLSIGGSALSEWIPGGQWFQRVEETLLDLKAAGLSPTHLLWHQGEADACTHNTPPEVYEARFWQMVEAIRALGISAPLYVCVATYIEGFSPNPDLQACQRRLGAQHDRGLYAGPDTDQLGLEYRFDGAHFSEQGLDRFAELWMDCLGAKA